MDMSKGIVLLLVLVFLTASCLIAFKPVSAASQNSWTTKAPMQVARYGLGVAVVNGKIYAIGGSTRSGGGRIQNVPIPVTGGTVGTNEEYDPETDTWTTKAPMPTPRIDFAIAVCNNKIYCIGGAGGVNEVYDPLMDTWENKTSMPTPQSLMSANVVNGKIYVIGGDSNKTINQVYDPAADSWTTKASMPSEVWGYASAVFDNKIYIIGYGSGYLNAIYDVENDMWSLGASPPSGVGFGKAGVTTGVNAPKRIYVLSASGFDTNVARTQFNQVYDPDYDRWMYAANFPTFRTDFAVAVVNDMLYVIGGYTVSFPHEIIDKPYGPTNTPYATNEQYTPFGYGTPDPSYVPPDITAPEIAVASPENRTYYTTDITLDFTVDESVSSMRYELDGETALEVSGNTSLTGLSYGSHNVTVYATDTSGNTGASETIIFTVAESEPFPTELAITASGALVAVIGVGLLVYFRKRKR
jgi:N-acetylneuraminic acid mutarotase